MKIELLGKAAAENAVLNANYLQARLKDVYPIPHDERTCMHEFVLSGRRQAHESQVHTLDIAKRLLDLGFHAPTIYFPLTVPEALTTARGVAPKVRAANDGMAGADVTRDWPSSSRTGVLVATS